VPRRDAPFGGPLAEALGFAFVIDLGIERQVTTAASVCDIRQEEESR
jgi:hypothetical protein